MKAAVEPENPWLAADELENFSLDAIADEPLLHLQAADDIDSMSAGAVEDCNTQEIVVETSRYRPLTPSELSEHWAWASGEDAEEEEELKISNAVWRKSQPMWLQICIGSPKFHQHDQRSKLETVLLTPQGIGRPIFCDISKAFLD